MTASHAHPIVAYSERLGPVTEIERQLEHEFGAEIRRVALWSPDDARTNAAAADVVIVGAVEPMDAPALAELANCRVLVRRGVGVDNVEIDAATALGIPVAFVPDASVEEVSDHALALLLALERRIVGLDRAVHAGTWGRDATDMVRQRRGMRRLATLTLGIVGLGRIGRALARKASPLVGRIVATDPYASEELATSAGAELVDLSTLLAESDLISLHSPHTPDTHHLLDAAAFERIRPGAYLVNTSRGGLVDDAALVDALRAGRLAGAGLDVNAEEPIAPDHPLLGFENVLLTGHSAASSEQSAVEMRTLAVEAARRALKGQRPSAVANPDVFSQDNCRLPVDDRA